MSEELNQTQNEQTEVVEETEVQAEQAQTEAKTFTQDEVNELIAKRLARETKKLDKYSDYEDVKTKAAEYEKLLEEKQLAELSEKERLEKIAQKHEAEKQTLAKQLEELQAKIRGEQVRNAFITKAQAAGIAYVDDAFQLSAGLLSAVNVDDEGVHGVDEIITELITNKPFLLAQTKKPQKPIGEPSNSNTNDEVKTLEAQLEDAKKAKDFAKVIELSNKIQNIFKK